VDDVVELPPTAGRLVVCPRCYSIKSNVVRRANDSQFALGADNIYTDPTSMNRTCRHPPQRTTTKRRQPTTEDTHLQLARQLCKRNPLACQHTEVVEINLIGQVLQFFNRKLFICPTCGAIAEYQPYHIRGAMPLCAVCHLNDNHCVWLTRNRDHIQVHCDFCDRVESQAIATRARWATVNVKLQPMQAIERQIDDFYYGVPCHRLANQLRELDDERVAKLFLCNNHMRRRTSSTRACSILDVCKMTEEICRENHCKRMRI